MFKKMIRLGLSSTGEGTLLQDRNLIKRVKLTNGIAMLLGSTALPFLIYYGLKGLWWPLFAMNMLFLLSYGLVLGLNYKGYFFWARWYLMVSSNMLILLGAYQGGKELQVHLAFFVLVCLPLVIFELKEKWSILFNMAYAPFFYFAVETFPQFSGKIPLETLPVGRSGEGLVIMMTLSIVVYYFRMDNERYEKDLGELLDKVSSQQQMIVHSSKMSALGEMAGGIAHEINNPLAAIQLKVSYLKALVQKNQITTERASITLGGIEETVRRISKIIQGLRTFAREEKEGPFQLEKVLQIINDSLDLCRERFQNLGIEIRLGSYDPSLEILCHPIQVSQILINLLNNSYDAIKGQEEKWVQIEVRDRGSRVGIEITDSGPGIPVAVRDKLFTPFFTTKEIGMGTGLGLSISKGLAEGQKGDLSFDFSSPHTRCVLTLSKGLAHANKGNGNPVGKDNLFL